MERSKSFDERLSRIMKAANISKDADLSKLLGINQSSVAAARKRGQLPPGWIEKIAEDFSINANWLFFGQGSMRLEESEKNIATRPQPPVTIQEPPACSRCAKLEAELELEKSERRELAQENRQLMRENANLRVEVAVKKEQLRAVSGRNVAADIA